LKIYIGDLEKACHENCYHKILKTYTNKFNTMDSRIIKLCLCKWHYFPPLTHELQVLWLHVIMKNKTYNMKNATSDTKKWCKKLKACACNLEKTYNESCNHENYYDEILKTYTNKFDIMKWAKKVFHSFHMGILLPHTLILCVHWGAFSTLWKQPKLFFFSLRCTNGLLSLILLGSKSTWTPKINPECWSHPPKHVQSKSETNFFFSDKCCRFFENNNWNIFGFREDSPIFLYNIYKIKNKSKLWTEQSPGPRKSINCKANIIEKGTRKKAHWVLEHP
jgi:hypothetical protein